jgi:hypothetical protein
MVGMPRDIFLRLETRGKSRDGYKATIETAWFLKQSGWSVLKKTRSYCYLKPPPGQRVGKLIDVRVPAPTDDEILAAANEMHAAAVSSFRMLHGWPMKYLPAHKEFVIATKIDPFTGVRGKSATARQNESAVCRIGFILIWQAEIRWRQNGQPTLTKYPKCEVSAPDSELFDPLSPLTEVSEPFPANPETFTEGAVQGVLVNVYERDPLARKACIDHYGAGCQACDFDFGQRYGEIGEGFIHVHHRKPLSEIGAQYQVDPIKDLLPVCPNCHAMIHRTFPPLSIDELRTLLNRGRDVQ